MLTLKSINTVEHINSYLPFIDGRSHLENKGKEFDIEAWLLSIGYPDSNG